MEVVLIGGVLAVGAAVAWLTYQYEKKRRAAFAALAARLGWSYAEEDDRWTERYSGSPFGTGRRRRATNVLSGELDGRPAVAFHYSYQTQSRDAQGHVQTRTHRYSVCSLALPTFLPQVDVTPENALTRIAGVLGFDDIELESEDFNRRFRVRGEDRKLACDVLTPRTMELLLGQSPLAWRIAGADIVAWDDGHADPEEQHARLRLLSAVVDGIPSFVWRDYR